jgi:hypothetical protein
MMRAQNYVLLTQEMFLVGVMHRSALLPCTRWKVQVACIVNMANAPIILISEPGK